MSVLRRLLPWLVVAALVVAAVVHAGLGRTDHPAAVPAPRPTPSEHPASVTAARAAVIVREVALRRADLPAGFGPDQVRRSTLDGGLPSLRLCDAGFGSESYRLARHQASFEYAAGRSRVSNETVLYRPGQAEQAVAELRDAASRCAHPVAPEPVEQPGTLALRVRVPGTTGHAAREVVVERRGDVLSVLYVDRPRGSIVLDLARRLSRRLEARLPVEEAVATSGSG